MIIHVDGKIRTVLQLLKSSVVEQLQPQDVLLLPFAPEMLLKCNNYTDSWSWRGAKLKSELKGRKRRGNGWRRPSELGKRRSEND